jgi:probable HAF family extracellular repeat protein
MQDLGTLGGIGSVAFAINNLGQIAGAANPGTNVAHAFLWDLENGMQDLGTLGGTHSEGLGINDIGQVVGLSLTSDGKTHAFLWDPDIGMQDLGLVADSNIINNGYFMDINDFSEVVGPIWLGSGGRRGFVWDPDNGLRILDSLDLARDINNGGQVVGRQNGPFGTRAVLWDADSGNQDLGALSGSFSEAFAVNELGQVAGSARLESSDFRGFIWDPDNGMQALGTLGGLYSEAHGINDLGQVAGYSAPPESPQGPSHAVIWQTTIGPEHQIAIIVQNVAELVDAGSLNEREAASLMALLDRIESKLDAENTKAACNGVKTFGKKIEAKQKSRKLTTEEVASLIVSVDALAQTVCTG